MDPVVRALDVGFGHTKFVSSVDGSGVRCAHFPSVAYPTESDETTDPMGGRRKTVGIPIDGLIYEVGPDVHLAADVFNAKQMHERYSETPEYLAMLRGALYYMKVERIDLLVVGLPVAAFKAKKRAALERLVLGKHDVGRGKMVQVERARVVPQPQGALMYYGHVHDRVAEVRKERSLIIDPGSMKNYDIDKYLAEINVAVDAVGGSVNLVGLCQGGWMSAMYAARFPRKLQSLVLAGAPIDTNAGHGRIREMAPKRWWVPRQRTSRRH